MLYLAYRRLPLFTFTVAFTVLLIAYSALGSPAGLWQGLLWLLLLCFWLLNLRPLRIALISRPFMRTYRRLLPAMSATERDALEAGTVWWEGELFTGNPDWRKLHAAAAPKLSAEEQAFLDGPCETLCRMLDDFDITHRRADMPPEVWQYIKSQGFFAMIIPKRYGGLEFSTYAHSCVLVKLAGRSVTCASTVAVPNSLGPRGTAVALWHRRAEEPLPAATGARRGDPLLRTDRAARGLGRRVDSRYRRGVSRPVAGTRSHRPEIQLLQALHHAGTGGDRGRAWHFACSTRSICSAIRSTSASPAH